MEGLRVLEFAWAGVGPIIGKNLAFYGATVIHVESATRPDLLRINSPFKDGAPGINRSGNWDLFHVNKYSMALNLNLPKAIEIAKKLASWADIVTASFRPGVMESLGLGYEDLKKVRSDIIVVFTSNQGQTGPHAKMAGYGTQMVSLAGFTYLTGWPDRIPAQPYGAYTDFIAPHVSTAVLLAALDYRRKTGRGQFIDISQYEISAHFLAPLFMDCEINGRVACREGNRSSRAVPHGAFPCKGDDRWCALAVFTEEQWTGFCGVLNHPGWVQDPLFSSFLERKKNEDELERRVAESTVQFTAEELMDRLQESGVPAGVVANAQDVQEDPQLKDFFWELDHPEIGPHHYEGSSFTLSETPAKLYRHSPLLGEHTEEVCKNILGMKEAEYQQLLSEGVFE